MVTVGVTLEDHSGITLKTLFQDIDPPALLADERFQTPKEEIRKQTNQTKMSVSERDNESVLTSPR